jgi:steroid 5-alpha reductase family enzyme
LADFRTAIRRKHAEATMADVGTLGTIASIIAGFGGAMLLFRLQRELQMQQEAEVPWIPWADRLLIFATLIALLLVLLPLVATTNRPSVMAHLPAAGCTAALILMAGYILAILAHYQLFLGAGRRGPRGNPEPAERVVVLATGLVALLAFLWVLWRYSIPSDL